MSAMTVNLGHRLDEFTLVDHHFQVPLDHAEPGVTHRPAAEAFAERLYERVCTEFWAYRPDETCTAIPSFA
jgi:hypothetical protein